jgi:hypothetical protein
MVMLMSNTLSLREKAHAAWLQEQKAKQQELKERALREPLLLQEKLRVICGDEYEIKVDAPGTPIVAEVDGLYFVSTYNEPHQLTWPAKMAENYTDVRLWWSCPKCGRGERSEVIRHTYELGKQLEKFLPEESHKCKEES